jgi:DNA-binding winged helix-turn-helix (wHTH) protein
MRLRFGDCVLDPTTRELWRAGRRVEVSPQGFELLGLLIGNRPRPLRQGELRDALWPETHVAHTALARVVSELRYALGDSVQREEFIRTVRRFGYAFVAPVVTEKGSGKPGECALVTDAQEFALPEGETLVGRGVECGVRLVSAEVSRVHARVLVRDRHVVLHDGGSKNGTWVNGVRLERPVTIQEGDEVLFGTYRAVFRWSSAQDTTRSAPA